MPHVFVAPLPAAPDAGLGMPPGERLGQRLRRRLPEALHVDPTHTPGCLTVLVEDHPVHVTLARAALQLELPGVPPLEFHIDSPTDLLACPTAAGSPCDC